MLQPVSPDSHPRGKWLRPWRAAAGLKTESVCGKCGYVVSGLPDFTCPECGSDLRDAGIMKRTVTAGATSPPFNEWPQAVRRRMRVQISLLVVAALLLLPFLPIWLTDHRELPFVPKSGAYRSVTISADFTRLHLLGAGYAKEPSSLPLGLAFVAKDGSPHGFTVDLPAERMSRPLPIRGPISFTLDSTVALDRWQVLTWLNRETGASVEDAKVEAEVDALMRLMTLYDDVPPTGWDALTADANKYLADNFTPGPASIRVQASSWQILRTLLPVLAALGLSAHWVRARARKRAKAILIAEGKWEEPPPEPKPAEARTLTVVFTDVKDFTARAAAASRADLVRLVRANRRLVERAVSQHGGRVVKTAGDGILCSFESATDAVLAALKTQRLARLQSQSAPGAESVELRIGISTGEVALEGDDVYGPAVNVAARIQALAVAGEVYLTEATRQAVTAAEVCIEPVGSFALKGVAGEVAVYRALPTSPAAPSQ